MDQKENNNLEPDEIVPAWYDKVYLMYSTSILWQTFP